MFFFVNMIYSSLDSYDVTVTSWRRLKFYHVEVNFKNYAVVQPLLCGMIVQVVLTDHSEFTSRSALERTSIDFWLFLNIEQISATVGETELPRDILLL